MTSKIKFARKELKLAAKSRGIKKPRSMSTDELLDFFHKFDNKREVENSRRKLLKLGLKNIAKIQNISKMIKVGPKINQ